jgi:hypothetical protein
MGVSCRLRRIEFGLKALNLVAQPEALLLEPAQAELVTRAVHGEAVDQVIEIGVGDFQLNQMARNRVKVVFHRRRHGPQAAISLGGFVKWGT